VSDLSGVSDVSGVGDHAGVRTYAPRWRRSPLTAERMATLLPARMVPEGPLDPPVAFGRTAPVALEIGSGHGAAAIAYAATHPDVDLVAAEVHVPGVARMLAAAEAAGVDNLWVEPGDALPLLRDRIPSDALAAVHLFFPDPWPKKRHAKRRFVQQHILDLLADRLVAGGYLLFATDHDGYAGHARRQLAAHGRWAVVEGERPAWRPVDGFEAKGLAAGRPITDLRATLVR
jgi:tRNA (guanine-N7-)-methyltransferase